jgi:uncharacterized protein (DUF362 family)
MSHPSTRDSRADTRVVLHRTAPTYPAQAPYHPGERYPEYDGPVSKTPNEVYAAVRATLRDLGLDAARFGSPQWNPIGALVPPASRIVIKPNWVLHANEGPGGNDCLFTHPSVLRPLIDYALKARPASLIVGDAPVQVCDFGALLAQGFAATADYIRSTGANLEVKDFRRTISMRRPDELKVQTDVKPLDDYMLVDLGSESLLEPISGDYKKFRVTMYDPRLMRNNHRPGVHRYLVARDILAADLVINVPKMKTHKKAGVTLALKNLIGINGNKDFLPHHRKGAANRGGDNYARASLPKRMLENLLDVANMYLLGAPRAYARFCRIAYRLMFFDRIRGQSIDVEGGWHGNDTIWRTCLDLNRILLYCDAEGRLRDHPQRNTLHVLDGVVAGDGNGPLRPDPVPAGVIMASLNPVALDYRATVCMGLNPRAIPIVREAMNPNLSRPLVISQLAPADHQPADFPRFRPAPGWEPVAAN